MSVTFTSHKKEVLAAEAQARAKALEICGGKAETYAKRLCPVDTGNLRNSITHKQYDENTEIIGTNVDYAPYVELGHYTKGGGKVAAKPFLRPAAENHAAEYREIIRRVMGDAQNTQTGGGYGQQTGNNSGQQPGNSGGSPSGGSAGP